MSLDSLEIGHSFTFRPEYRRFAEGARNVRLADAPAKLGKDWVRRVAEVFTLDELVRDYNETVAAWDTKLLRFAYPIARTYSGDAIVQVASGKHAGKIVMTDHETYAGFFDVLATFVPTAAQQKFLASEGATLKKLGFVASFVTADHVIGLALGGENGDLVADSFEEFLATLEAFRALTYDLRELPITPRLNFRKLASKTKIDATLAATLGDALVLGGGPSGLHVGTDPAALERIEGLELNGLAVGGGVLWTTRGTEASSSVDGGRTFVPAKLDSKHRLFTLTGVVADATGAAWISGMHAIIASGHAGEPLCALDVPRGEIIMPTVLADTRHGVAVADRFGLYIVRDGKLARTALETSGICRLLETVAGTLIALDDDCGLHRSDDGGATWTACDRPRPQPESVAVISAMANVGRSVVVASDIVLVSHDDGRTFEPVREKLPRMRCATSLGEGGIFVGTDGTRWMVTIGTPESAPIKQPAKRGRRGAVR